MEDFDDDFGDLYAGVEEQANSAINGVQSFGKLYAEPEEDARDDNDMAKTATAGSADGLEADEKPNSVPEDLGEKVLALEEEEDDDGSESEDDLKIVLNDEDCEGQIFPRCTKIDEQENEEEDGFVAMNEYRYVRTQGTTCPSNGKTIEVVGLESSMVVRGEYANSVCNQQKGSSQIAGICDKPGLLVTHNRYGFRLPWYRTILDVNIDSFEEKSWRNPRVDITDYFNFGLDEDSWKQYCNSLEQLRLTRMQLGIPFSGLPKFYQAKEAGSEYEKFAQETIVKETNSAGPRKLAPPSSRVSDSVVRELELPKGRAIEIEDSVVERQPSFGSRQPRSLDSDVVIQIAVQDMTEDTSTSGEDQGRTNGIAYEASDNGEFDANNNITPAKQDDLLVGTLEGKTRRLDRFSQQISASRPMTVDSDSRRNNQIVELDGYDRTEVNGISLETLEITNKTKESFDRNTFSPDKYMMEAQISLGDEDEISPTSSYFANDSEASKKSVHFDPEDVCTPVRSPVNPDMELCESVRSSLKNSKGNGIKRKLIDTDDYSTHKSPAHKECKHQYRRLGSIVEPNISTVHDDASPTSGTEDLYDRDSSLNSRRNKRRGDIGGGDRKDFSGYKESRHFGNRNVYNYVDSARTNYLNRRVSQKFQDKLDPYVRKTWNEREYFGEDRDADSHRFGSTQFTKERHSLPSRDFRGWHSMYSSHTVEARNSQSRRNGNQLQFKKTHNRSGVYDKHEDGFVEGKFGRCVSLADRKRNILDELDERQFPWCRREIKNSGGRGGYVDSPVCYWDDSCSAQTENEYCGRENQHLSHQSYQELYTADEGKWNDCQSPRNDVSYSRKTDERYWRHGRNSYSAGARESAWFDNRYEVDEIDDIIYTKDHFESRRSNWRSEALHCTEDQLSVRHHGDRLYSEKASCSYQKYVRHGNFHVNSGSSRDGRHIGDMLPEHLRLKLLRKGISANCIDRGSKMYRGKPQQAVLMQRDSNNLVVGEGKFSGRFSKGRNLKGNTKLENMDPEMGGDQTTLVDSSESEKVRTVEFDTSKGRCIQNKEKRMDKFPVLAQNDVLNLDIEGQIVAEEVNTARPLQRKRTSEYSAAASDVKQRMLDNESASSEKKVVEGYDNQRILATMAKMEKRGERFKVPITLKKQPDKLSQPELDLLVEAAEAQHHRPTRKRRWGRIEVV